MPWNSVLILHTCGFSPGILGRHPKNSLKFFEAVRSLSRQIYHHLEEGFSKCRHTPRPSAWLSTTVASISSGVASALGAACRHWPLFFAHLFLYGAQTVLPHRSPSEILWLQLFWAHLVLTSSRSLSNAPNRISIGSKLDFMFCAKEFKRNHEGSQGLAWPMFPTSRRLDQDPWTIIDGRKWLGSPITLLISHQYQPFERSPAARFLADLPTINHGQINHWNKSLDDPPSIAQILMMEEILQHLGCIKPCKEWDKLPTSTGAGFFPSTVFEELTKRTQGDPQNDFCWSHPSTDKGGGWHVVTWLDTVVSDVFSYRYPGSPNTIEQIRFVEEIRLTSWGNGSLSYHLQGKMHHPRWLFRISEPSTAGFIKDHFFKVGNWSNWIM